MHGDNDTHTLFIAIRDQTMRDVTSTFAAVGANCQPNKLLAPDIVNITE
ncbi:hypothetical protein BML2537_20550 [Providencia stuartii]|nr:hypothetical protein BML2537_20550 [Providencia stuartii]